MIEIVTEVDLFHPPARTWRALTERALLAKWFADSAPGSDRWILATAALPGYDDDTEVETVELRAPHRLVVRCRETDRATRLACDLAPTAHGTRLSVREVLEEGDWDAEARAEQHEQAVTGRLPAILDWLAFQNVDLRRAEGGLTAELPVVRLLGDEPRRPGRRRALLAAGAVTLLATAAGATMWATGDDPPAPAAPAPTTSLVMPSAATPSARPTTARPTPSASRRSVSPSPTPSPTRSRTPSPPPSAVSAPLSATYETVNDRIFGYRGEVVLRNPGPSPRPGWTVTVTLHDGATVGSVSGAEATQNGAVVTFTGDALPAGGSTVIRFDVRDPDPQHDAPAGCAADNTPCTPA
ncbi:SRPBCC domain-containing protein [Micromonospora chalcea]|uniref:SRPBCC domain-containing protein n=1 Tax=Micromonospora chalcea TaxID=1874 RepID=UPI00157DDB49|nr:SRPBCC domain-containing protein [Micromonospora chalcea]